MSKLMPRKWAVQGLLALALVSFGVVVGIGVSFGVVIEEKKFQWYGDKAWTWAQGRRVTAERFLYLPVRDTWNACHRMFGIYLHPCWVFDVMYRSAYDFTYPNGRSYDGHY
jgi:hypothetical protein